MRWWMISCSVLTPSTWTETCPRKKRMVSRRRDCWNLKKKLNLKFKIDKFKLHSWICNKYAGLSIHSFQKKKDQLSIWHIKCIVYSDFPGKTTISLSSFYHPITIKFIFIVHRGGQKYMETIEHLWLLFEKRFFCWHKCLENCCCTILNGWFMSNSLICTGTTLR